MSAIDLGYRAVVLRRGPVSGLIGVRSIVVCGILVVLILGLGIASLGIGTYPLSPAQVVGALLGTDDDTRTRLLVVTWRLPRALFAIACGVALAVSGAIFQSLTRNPLGSPDIIGFSTGSYTGVVLMTLVVGSTGYLDRAAAAVVGGCVTAAIVYLLSVSRGTVRSFRLIIMGIGVGALLGSLNSALMISSDVDAAMLTAVWAAGSLYGLSHAQLWPMVALLVVMLPVVAFIAPGLRQLELGDDAAHGLGVRARRVQATAVIMGVALTALVTAAAGPISFIALAAPQVARRLTRGSGLELVPSALVGAFLLLASDVLAAQLGFPVGIVTVSVGGAYLVWLLAAEYRKRT
ncbi:FecCD family ABC transporter permease [Tessaracoccus palaemonis]|uniref:Iron chelate uptake ABC transporter family permease subunit n=1 Tax=Tessaracoccus palaemonis TaxID=2829499 RepID=A0ABX8SGN8_9ACTN|nr:iron chelate uptake ABC transporter family permease subunit [Tessaracoccus palaemonis]QXT61605.1 iron chelate uptake ABC transporter family permease subunit [Tessaracoccus palaemonis]